MSTLWQDVQLIRERAPLVHNITNYVVMNVTANALLAIGASPVMAHAVEEVEEMAGIASALVLNIGTLSSPWIEAMFRAGRVAKRRQIPIVLDPVGAGATKLRTETSLRILEELSPTIVRGNASEIRALGGADGATKGVDSTHQSDAALEAAHALAARHGCVVSVSGATDLVVDGPRVARIDNGRPLMTRVTGSGCSATVLTGAFAAVNPSAFEAGAHAMALSGICGEIATELALGPGSYQAHFLDVLHAIDEEQMKKRLQMKMN
jgi:hydroxyethylthiazole kinase